VIYKELCAGIGYVSWYNICKISNKILHIGERSVILQIDIILYGCGKEMDMQTKFIIGIMGPTSILPAQF
jgi:hypothetical protein